MPQLRPEPRLARVHVGRGHSWRDPAQTEADDLSRLGILHLEERFLYDGREEARLVYGTEDPRHPGAAYQLTRGDVCLAGKVDLIARPPLKEFEPYRLDATKLALADADAVAMHDLPAHVGEEITEEVLYGSRSLVWEQAENRLHTQKAVMALVIH